MGVVEWSVSLKSCSHELKTSYEILVFLGCVPEDSDKWRSSGHFVGAHESLVSPDPKEEDTIIGSVVPLQRALEILSQLETYTPQRVVPYLTKELRWRVQKLNGTVVENSRLTSLQVKVFTSDSEKGAPSKIEFPECTEGRNGI